MMRFETEAGAIALANDSRYGLVAGVWSENVSRVHRVMEQLLAGAVWGNTWRIIHHQAPFGGFGDSAIGRELGVEALHAYSETKNHWLGLGA
jgi:aldehyde dehydrogenase (NAD+)